MKRLIVNADDLGRSPGVNRGILRAHREGVVTSTTLMANAPYAAEAAALARDQRRLGVGVHLVLTFGRPLSPARAVPSLIREDGTFPPRPHLVRGKLRGEEVLAEFRRQIEHATKLLGHAPTHLDTHHFVQDESEVLWAVMTAAKEHALPLRHSSPKMREELRHARLRTSDHFTTAFYGREAVGVTALLGMLDRLRDGTTELMCHPGVPDAELRGSSYYEERALELETLCDPSVRRAVRGGGIELITFADL